MTQGVRLRFSSVLAALTLAVLLALAGTASAQLDQLPELPVPGGEPTEDPPPDPTPTPDPTDGTGTGGDQVGTTPAGGVGTGAGGAAQGAGAAALLALGGLGAAGAAVAAVRRRFRA